MVKRNLTALCGLQEIKILSLIALLKTIAVTQFFPFTILQMLF